MTMEPAPENVAGEVVHRHSFEHRIDWGYVALALAAIVIVAKLSGSSGVSVGQPGEESESSVFAE